MDKKVEKTKVQKITSELIYHDLIVKYLEVYKLASNKSEEFIDNLYKKSRTITEKSEKLIKTKTEKEITKIYKDNGLPITTFNVNLHVNDMTIQHEIFVHNTETFKLIHQSEFINLDWAWKPYKQCYENIYTYYVKLQVDRHYRALIAKLNVTPVEEYNKIISNYINSIKVSKTFLKKSPEQLLKED